MSTSQESPPQTLQCVQARSGSDANKISEQLHDDALPQEAACQGGSIQAASDSLLRRKFEVGHLSEVTESSLGSRLTAPELFRSDNISQSSSTLSRSLSETSTIALLSGEDEQSTQTQSEMSDRNEEQQGENESPEMGQGGVVVYQTPQRPVGSSNIWSEARAGMMPQTMTPSGQPLPIFVGYAASPGQNLISTTPAAHTQFWATAPTFNPPSSSSYQSQSGVSYAASSGLGQGLYYPQTPASFDYGNPIPTTYNRDRVRPAASAGPPHNTGSPLPSRAMTSTNWRRRETSQARQSPGDAQALVPIRRSFNPGHNINQGFGFLHSTALSYPSYAASTQPIYYSALTRSSYHYSQTRNHEPFYAGRHRPNFFGLVPSSVSKTSNPTLQHVEYTNGFTPQPYRISREQARAANNLPTVYSEDELVDGKVYARWNGGYVEVDDDLISRCICPADLLQHPCPWDELGDGCQMVRLCVQLEKNTDWACWDAEDGYERAEVFEGEDKEYQCPHLHWEVEPTCRFVGSNKYCVMVLTKGFECAVGHDFEVARQVSRCRFEAHIRDALLAGATREATRRSIIFNNPRDHTHHIEMAEGPGPMPVIRLLPPTHTHA